MNPPNRAERSDLVPRLAGIAWILLTAWVGVWLSGPGGVAPENAPATEFSAERAMRHIQQMARAPHPVGSAEHARVRDYVMAQLSALGLEPTVQKTTGVLAEYGVAATVENIVARKRGSAGGPAVLLAAHYDSVPAGPGAGDDGAGVACLLETARALAAGPALEHDVIFLFTDGEELGLLGAAAFAAEHPWKKDAAVALNFDNRGTRGAVLMYETSAGNLALVRELAAATRSPRASSLSAAVARLMPNSSDFFVLRKAGLAGLNFAFIDGLENYHTPQDTPANVDLRTLQQSGSYALPLVRRLAARDLTQLAHLDGPDAIYFNPAGNWLVVYRKDWARGIGFGVLVLFLAVVVVGLERGAARVGGLLLGLILCAVNVLAAWRAADWMALSLPRFHSSAGHAGPFLHHPLYAAALACLVAGLTFAIWELAGLRWEEIALAGAGIWSAGGVALAYLFPEASFLAVWPLVPGLVVLGILLAWSPGKPGERGAGQTCLAWLGAVPAVLVLAPLVPAVESALGIGMFGAAGQAVVVALSMWLVAAGLAPGSGRVGRVSFLMLAAGVAILATALATVRYNDRHPRPEWMAYVKDADRSTTQWMSESGASAISPGGARLDPWRSQYLGASPAPVNLPISLPFHPGMMCWAQAAPEVELAPPAAELLSEVRKDDGRELRILLRQRRGVARLSLEVQAPRILALRVNGRVLGQRRVEGAAYGALVTHGGAYQPRDQREVWTLLYAAPPEEGLEVDVEIPVGMSVELTVGDISDGLPAIPGRTYSPRPASVTQQQFSDMTVVVKSFHF